MKYTGVAKKKHPNQVVSGAIILKYWIGDVVTAREHAGFHIRPTGFYEVSWPDYVTSPRFDVLCTILREVIDARIQNS